MKWFACLTPLVAAALTATGSDVGAVFVLLVAAMPYSRPVERLVASYPTLKKAE
jgi:hypothetical protein